MEHLRAAPSRVTSLFMVLMLLVSCGGTGAEDSRAGSSAPASATASPSFGHGSALIQTEDDSVLLTVEVAQTDRQRQVGLMHRKSLPEDEGMVFIYFEPHEGGFWMKDTLIPLSIAFFDEEGKIIEMLDMEPCEREPCKIYDPGVSYTGALEVNQGAYERWGVEIGDQIRIVQ